MSATSSVHAIGEHARHAAQAEQMPDSHAPELRLLGCIQPVPHRRQPPQRLLQERELSAAYLFV